MPKFLITLPTMPKEQIQACWKAVVDASVGSQLTLDNAYIDENKAQAVCCWNAPDKPSVEELFSKAGVAPQEIQEVVQFTA